MKTITIGFSTSHTLFSSLIRWFSSSKVSHTYIRMPLYSSCSELVFQASGLKVNIEGYKHFESHSTVVKEIELQISDEKYEELEVFMCDSLGKPYSIKQILGMVLVLVCRSVGCKIKNPFRDGDHSYVCVELVANILNIPNAEDMTPQDLLDILS